jgi:hypothetical protein
MTCGVRPLGISRFGWENSMKINLSKLASIN